MIKTFILLSLFALIYPLPAPGKSNGKAAAITILEPEVQHRKVAQLITRILTHRHYLQRTVDDSLSATTFDNYLETLDPNRLYFLESDIESFQKQRLQFDDYFLDGYMQPAYEMFNVFQERFVQRLNYIYTRVEQPFDFSNDEYMELDRDRSPWAKSTEVSG